MKTFIQSLKPHLGTILLVCILILGAYLRIHRISEYMTFLGDEGRDMLVIKRMIVDHKFTLLGPTASVGGFFLGPVYYYFMLPFVWVSGLNPAGAAFMVALFGISTIYLVYLLGTRMFDRWVGISSAAVYSVSPVVIAYSRSSWNPNLVPFFATLLIYLLWQSVIEKRPKNLFWVGVVLGIGLQLHYLFLFLFPVVGIWYALYGRQRTWLRYYLLGILGFVIGYGPFLAFELRHGFPNTISIYDFLRAGEGTGLELSRVWNNIVEVTYRLFGRLVFRLPPPEQWSSLSSFAQYTWPLVVKFSIFSSLGLLTGYLARVFPVPWETEKRETDRPKRQGLVLLLLWYIVPMVLFGLYKKGIYDYYFGLFFVLPFIMTVLLLRSLHVTKAGKLFSAVCLSGLLYLNWQGQPFKFEPNNQLAQVRSIAKSAYDKAGGKPFNFALITGGNSDHAYRYFFEIWGNAPVTIENVEKDPQRRSVTDQLIVICETNECKPLGHPLWEIAGFGRAEVAGEWEVSFVKIMRLVHYEGDETL